MPNKLLEQIDRLEIALAEAQWASKRDMFLNWLIQQPNRPWT